jgi:hypothetical protein
MRVSEAADVYLELDTRQSSREKTSLALYTSRPTAAVEGREGICRAACTRRQADIGWPATALPRVGQAVTYSDLQFALRS